MCVCTFPCLRLRLKERPLYEFKAVDLGNVCHRALELFSKKASEAGGWTVLPEEERKKLIDASVEEAITDYGNSVLYSTARNEQMIVRMKQMLERTVWALTNQLKAGDFVPEAYDYVSSEERLTALIYVRRKSRYMSKLWITRPEVRHLMWLHCIMAYNYSL